MCFKSKKRSPVLHPIYLNESPLEFVTSFKYLGHFLNPDLKDNEDMERERRSLAVRANMISRRFFKCSSHAKVTLFRAYCQSLYTCQLWSSYTVEMYRTLKVQYNDCFRILFALPRCCSASTMFTEARLPGLDALMRHRMAKFRLNTYLSCNLLVKNIYDICRFSDLFKLWNIKLKT